MPQGGYHRGDGRWVSADTATGFASAAVSGTVAGIAVEMGSYGTLRADIVTSAPSGSPSITVALQTSKDAGVLDPWRTLVTSAAITTATTNRMSVGGVDRFARANITFSGTGSITTAINYEQAI